METIGFPVEHAWDCAQSQILMNPEDSSTLVCASPGCPGGGPGPGGLLLRTTTLAALPRQLKECSFTDYYSQSWKSSESQILLFLPVFKKWRQVERPKIIKRMVTTMCTASVQDTSLLCPSPYKNNSQITNFTKLYKYHLIKSLLFS